jgi:glucosamine kinase
MKLIIDSGTTKTHWVLLDGQNIIEDFQTTGFNPYYMTAQTIREIIARELPEKMRERKVEKIFFYGTGCSTKSNCQMVQSILQSFFRQAITETHHDLYGAAVALLKNQEGIATILGTGSNSCLWNGREIVENVPSVGWIIGDEGSATYLGKVMLKAFLSGEMPDEITREFYSHTGLNFEGILHKIYSEPQPNRWISGLSPFASKHIKDKAVRELVKKNFRDFLETQVKKYTGYRDAKISFTGSVAWYFREILQEVLKEEGLHLGIILQQPMDGLIEFHSDLS